MVKKVRLAAVLLSAFIVLAGCGQDRTAADASEQRKAAAVTSEAVSASKVSAESADRFADERSEEADESPEKTEDEKNEEEKDNAEKHASAIREKSTFGQNDSEEAADKSGDTDTGSRETSSGESSSENTAAENKSVKTKEPAAAEDAVTSPSKNDMPAASQPAVENTGSPAVNVSPAAADSIPAAEQATVTPEPTPSGHYVHHDAVTHEEPVYGTVTHTVEKCICNDCGEDITSLIESTGSFAGHAATHPDCWGYHTEHLQITEQMQTGTITVVDQEAYDEWIPD